MKLSSCLERAHYLYVSLTLLIHLIENGKTNEKFSPKKNARNTYHSSYPPRVAIFSTAILTSLPLYTLTLPLITFFFFFLSVLFRVHTLGARRRILRSMERTEVILIFPLAVQSLDRADSSFPA